MTCELFRKYRTIHIHILFSVFKIFNFQTDNEIEKKLQSITFLGPFERYKLVKPYVQEQEKKAEAERAKKKEEENETSVNGEELLEERTNEQRIEAVSIFLFLFSLTLVLIDPFNPLFIDGKYNKQITQVIQWQQTT